MGKPNKATPYLLAHMYDGCCSPWPFHRHVRQGYAVIYNQGTMRRAHQVVCELIYGPKPSKKHEVRHLCGKGHLGCFNAGCLKWGTRSDNLCDTKMHDPGHMCGERNRHSKLTETDVRRIRYLRGVLTQQALADHYGVTQSQISTIQLGKQWHPALG